MAEEENPESSVIIWASDAPNRTEGNARCNKVDANSEKRKSQAQVGQLATYKHAAAASSPPAGRELATAHVSYLRIIGRSCRKHAAILLRAQSAYSRQEKVSHQTLKIKRVR